MGYHSKWGKGRKKLAIPGSDAYCQTAFGPKPCVIPTGAAFQAEGGILREAATPMVFCEEFSQAHLSFSPREIPRYAGKAAPFGMTQL